MEVSEQLVQQQVNAEQYPTDSSASYAMMKHKQMEQFNIYRLESMTWIEQFAHELAGEVFVQIGNEIKWFQTGFAHLNSEGVKVVISVLNAYCNKDDYMSIRQEPHINKVCKIINDELSVILFVYRKKYGVVHPNLLIDMIVDKVHGGYSRSLKGREAELISKSHYDVEQKTYTQQPKKGFIQSFRDKLSPQAKEGMQ